MKQCIARQTPAEGGMAVAIAARWFSRCSAALVAMGLAMGSGQASAACKIRTVELPVTMTGSRAVATLGLNGHDTRLIVDSGAFYSTLTHAAAQQLKLKLGPLPWGMRIEGLTGEVESGLTTVDRVQLLKGEIPNVQFLVGGNDDNNGTMGLLGRNFLAMADTEYDLAHGVVRLVFPDDDCRDSNMAYWASNQPVSEVELLRDPRDKSPPIQAIAKLNDQELRVMFDTGASSLVSLKAARKVGVTDMRPTAQVQGAGQGQADGWTGQFKQFELGDESISNVQLRVVDFDRQHFDMLLGIDFFLSHRIYVSKKQRRMYFTYNGGTIFALNARESAKAQSAMAAEPAASEASPLPDAAAYARRGAALRERREYARALADFDRACAMAPEVATYFVQRAGLHRLMRQPGLALHDYDSALQRDPVLPGALLERAALHVHAGDRDAAIKDIEALDKVLMPQAAQRIMIARMYETLKMPARSLPQWTYWIDSHPHDSGLANALNARCWNRMMLAVELDGALADCDRAIGLQPRNGDYLDSRAWLQMRRGELRKSLDDYERALKLNPSSKAWPLYGRGLVRNKLGDERAAQADLEEARKLDATVEDWARQQGFIGNGSPASPQPGG